MVSTELLLAVVGVIATLLGGLAYMGKRRADAQLLAAQGELQRIKDEGTRFEQLMALINSQSTNLQRQIDVNQAFTLALQQKEREDERNYQTLKSLWDRHAVEINTVTRDSRDRVLERIDQIPARNIEALQTVMAEISVTLAEVVRAARGDLERKVSALEMALEMVKYEKSGAAARVEGGLHAGRYADIDDGARADGAAPAGAGGAVSGGGGESAGGDGGGTRGAEPVVPDGGGADDRAGESVQKERGDAADA